MRNSLLPDVGVAPAEVTPVMTGAGTVAGVVVGAVVVIGGVGV
jgi:hypothetical protein